MLSVFNYTTPIRSLRPINVFNKFVKPPIKSERNLDLGFFRGDQFELVKHKDRVALPLDPRPNFKSEPAASRLEVLNDDFEILGRIKPVAIPAATSAQREKLIAARNALDLKLLVDVDKKQKENVLKKFGLKIDETGRIVKISTTPIATQTGAPGPIPKPAGDFTPASFQILMNEAIDSQAERNRIRSDPTLMGRIEEFAKKNKITSTKNGRITNPKTILNNAAVGNVSFENSRFTENP